MRIAAFSDCDAQDLQKIAGFMAGMKPDVILYAGNHTGRFGPLDGAARALLLACNRGKGSCIRRCTPVPDGKLETAPGGKAGGAATYPQLPDTYYFNLPVLGAVTKNSIIEKVSEVLRKGDTSQCEASSILRLARHEGVSAESLLKGASVHFQMTPGGAEGTISFRTQSLTRQFAAAAKYGFGAVLGGDDHPAYKRLLAGKKVFDLHDEPIRVGGFTIMGQEGEPCGRGPGRLAYGEDEVRDHLESSLRAEGDSRTILVSHVPPYNVLDHDGGVAAGHAGSSAVSRFIAERKPLLVLCGQARSHGGCQARMGPTTITNVASNNGGGSPARVCILDISKDLSITTKWFLVLPDRILDCSAPRLKEGEAVDSVLGMPGIGQGKAQELEMNGIRTIRDVVAAGTRGLAQAGIDGAAAQRALKQAESLCGQRAVHIAPLLIPKKPLMFVDIEMDPVQSYIWLISALLEGGNGEPRLFFAESPADEKSILVDFLSYCRESGRYVFCYYSGSWVDECMIKRQIAAHGLDGGGLGGWFDLYPAIKNSVALPTKSLSLKSVAGHFGYEYKHKGMDGYRAALKYVHTIGRRRESTTKALLEYGKDDVMILEHMVSSIKKVTGTAPDRRWEPPEHTLPMSFEEECTVLRSRIRQGLSVPEVAAMYGRDAGYVRTRLEAEAEAARGKRVAFSSGHAARVGAAAHMPQGFGPGARPGRAHHTMHGEVLEQLSKNLFKIRAGGDTFQVGRRFLRWE